MDFRETLAAVFADGYEGDASADLTTAYENYETASAAQIAELTASNEAAMAELQAQSDAFSAERNALQAENYRLLSRLPSTIVTEPEDEVDDGEMTVEQLIANATATE